MHTTVETLDNPAGREVGARPRIASPKTYWVDVTHLVTAALNNAR